MREDMFKVIVERPRRGSRDGHHYSKGDKRRLDRTSQEELPRRESSAKNRRFGYDAKELNEHLAPLRRFLEKQVGQRWDDVYSEICEHLSQNNPVQSHVRDHVGDYVSRCVEIVGGTVFELPHSLPGGHRTVAFSFGELRPGSLYVHPETGILCRVPKASHARPKKTPEFVRHPRNNMKQFRQIDGVWYEITLARFKTWEDLYEQRLSHFDGRNCLHSGIRVRAFR